MHPALRLTALALAGLSLAGPSVTSAATAAGATAAGARATGRARPSHLARPQPLRPFAPQSLPGEGSWRPAGRSVAGVPALYETTLTPPGGSAPSGVAWMDTRLLSARLYSGSMSPGGGPYRFTAPIEPAQASSLVAAFNGGFKMGPGVGGYFTEGRVVDPLQAGKASLVISAGGEVTVGIWDRGVSMTRDVVAVRQNLGPLVAGGRPTPAAASADWKQWGNTCGATSCAPGVPGIEHQWRSGVGVTRDGALVYVAGPALSPLQLAQLLVRAGVMKAMELDINPDWPDFSAYSPATPNGLASASNGSRLLAAMVQGPWTFFAGWWPRDFVTMSVRPGLAG